MPTTSKDKSEIISSGSEYKVIRKSTNSRFKTKIAETSSEIDEALRLRYAVFNLELDEGLDSSKYTGRDEDKFDTYCDHLIITDTLEDRVIGTYRLQTIESADKGLGFYSDNEFDLQLLDPKILLNGLELGRACIHSYYRNSRVLSLLWQGIAAYMVKRKKRYAFGCCSLNSQDLKEGYALYYHLMNLDYVDIKTPLLPRGDYYFPDPGEYTCQYSTIPSLMNMYLRYGAKIISLPALDSDFKTIDYFMLLDIEQSHNIALKQLMQYYSGSI